MSVAVSFKLYSIMNYLLCRMVSKSSLSSEVTYLLSPLLFVPEQASECITYYSDAKFVI